MFLNSKYCPAQIPINLSSFLNNQLVVRRRNEVYNPKHRYEVKSKTSWGLGGGIEITRLNYERGRGVFLN